MGTPAAQPNKPKRRSPISRSEGELRLISAARQLITTKPFSEVGVREIAELADVNHGFVHTWFGSKNDLLLAVVRELALEIVKTVESAQPGQLAINITNSDVQLLVRLVLWLNLEGVNTRLALPELPIVKSLESRYVEVDGMRPDVAGIAALHAVSIGLGAVTFAPLLSEDDNINIGDSFALLRHIVGLLVQHPPA